MKTHLLLLLCSVVCYTAALSRLRQFHLSKERSNWSAARTYCQENYTNLVTMYNQEDSEQLMQLFANEIPIAWIGLSRTQPSLKWSNGDLVNVTAWSPLPSLYTEPTCAAILKDNTTWEKCTEQKYFMCYRKGSCDPFLIEQNKTWYEAQSYCRGNYTDLIRIRNKGMEEEEEEEVKKRGMNSTTPFWIGLLYDDWKWADGGYSAYRNWSTELQYPSQIENFTVLYNNSMTILNNGSIYKTFCSEGSVRIHIISEKKSWQQALDYCMKNYHGLMCIETAKDLDAIKQKFNGTNFTDPVWVGLRQSRLFGFWVWTNGLPVKWNNWEEDRQPELPLSNHCGAMSMKEGYKWSDQDCLSKHLFICEEKLKNISP